MIRWFLQGSDDLGSIPVTLGRMLPAIRYTEHEQGLNFCGIVSRTYQSAEDVKAEHEAFWARNDHGPTVLPMRARAK